MIVPVDVVLEISLDVSPSNVAKILSISFSKVINCSITRPLFNNNIFTESVLLLSTLSVKATLILPPFNSKGIHLYFLQISKLKYSVGLIFKAFPVSNTPLLPKISPIFSINFSESATFKMCIISPNLVFGCSL